MSCYLIPPGPLLGQLAIQTERKKRQKEREGVKVGENREKKGQAWNQFYYNFPPFGDACS